MTHPACGTGASRPPTSLAGLAAEYRELASRAEGLSERLTGDLLRLMYYPVSAKTQTDLGTPISSSDCLADDLKVSATRLGEALGKVTLALDALEDSMSGWPEGQ